MTCLCRQHLYYMAFPAFWGWRGSRYSRLHAQVSHLVAESLCTIERQFTIAGSMTASPLVASDLLCIQRVILYILRFWEWLEHENVYLAQGTNTQICLQRECFTWYSNLLLLMVTKVSWFCKLLQRRIRFRDLNLDAAGHFSLSAGYECGSCGEILLIFVSQMLIFHAFLHGQNLSVLVWFRFLSPYFIFHKARKI